MNPYLMPGLGAGPVVLERLVRAIPESRLDEPSHPGRFSTREVVAHLADWEPILLERMKSAVASPGAVVIAYDEGERAIENRYATSDVNVQLDLYRVRRKQTIEWLESLAQNQWSSHIDHPERGRLTVYDIACMMVGHDTYHFEQITTLFEDKTAGTW